MQPNEPATENMKLYEPYKGRLSNYRCFWGKEKKIFLKKKTMFLILFAWLVILIIFYQYFLFERFLLQKNKKELQVQYKRDVEVKLSKEDNLVAVFPDNFVFQRVGVASYFDYLTTFSVSGLWLTSISIDIKAGEIKLTGHAFSPSNFDNFVSNLRASDSPYAPWILINSEINKDDDSLKKNYRYYYSRYGKKMNDEEVKNYYNFTIIERSSWYIAPVETKKRRR